MAEDWSLPDGFRFGVATAGFQIEGGYNGRDEPSNNWSWWEAEGRVEPSGIALDFWNGHEQHLDRAAAAGCDAFRMSIEWARCEPLDGELDDEAIDRYCHILDACHERNLQPLVTLHHFTHPAWLGVDFWLRPDSPERFAGWAHVALERFAGRCNYWVTINEINVYAIQTYLTGMFPPGRRMDISATVRALDNMLAGHVLAYASVKDRQPQAVVATNNYALSIYELDRLLTDVLLARSHGIGRYELHDWLVERRAEFRDAVGPRHRLEWLLGQRAASAVPLEQAVPRTVAEVYASAHERTLDVVQLDYYDPVVHHHLRVPGHKTAGGRNWRPGRMLWDDPPNPAGLAAYSMLNQEPSLDLWVVENGLCNRVRNGRAYPRADGWTRERYLKENIAALLSAADAGVPVTGYYHWTLADNYEWGSYEPRFGLYGVDRARANVWSDQDSMGGDACGTYRRIVERLREGDRSALQ